MSSFQGTKRSAYSLHSIGTIRFLLGLLRSGTAKCVAANLSAIVANPVTLSPI